MEEKKYIDMNEEPGPDNLYGTIVSCNKLRVRTAPSKEADVIAIIDRNTEVLIDESESREDFFRICTATGIVGYCMKQFVKVEEKNHGRQHIDID